MRVFLLFLLLCPLFGLGADQILPQNEDTKKAHPSKPEQRGLRLEVDANLSDILTAGPPEMTMKWDSAILTVDIAVRNISASPITVPTKSFDDKVATMNWPSWGEDMERILVNIESPKFQGKPAAYAESRFAPVVLAPGECALLLHHTAFIKDRKHADAIKEASVHFGISSAFVGPEDWWRGHLEAYADITRRQGPDKEITDGNAHWQHYQARQADRNYLPAVPARIAALIARADHAGIRGQLEPKEKEVEVRDPVWLRQVSEAVAAVTLTRNVACFCTGWRTAYFHDRDGLRLISLAAIHGNQLRLHWGIDEGGDFPIDEDQWNAVKVALEYGDEPTPVPPADTDPKPAG